MARSIKYWLDVMFEEKTSMPSLNSWEPDINNTEDLLDVLTNSSRVSIFALLFWCIAACAVALDIVFGQAISVMQDLAAKSRYGTLPWYVAIAKEFQYGDGLVQVNQEYVYNPVIPANRIVALAASKEGTGVVNVKIAKMTGATPEPLDSTELAAFTAYMAKKKPGGINVQIINDEPDELRFYANVIINPLILKLNGESIALPGTFPVEEAINAYLISLSTVDFDGRFDTMKAIDFIQKTLGVEAAYTTAASARYGANPFVAFTQTYSSNAGYMVIDPTTPLSGTITYVENV